MNKIKSLILMVLLTSLTAVHVHAESVDTAVQKKTAPKPTLQILFFLNPNGRPCQMQDAILNEMKDTLKSLATVKYIKTTNRADHSIFREYGVRGLPMLIIVNAEGKIVKQFTPGIKRQEEIVAALQKKK